MIIGYDGSRAFTDRRTGTENYAFQILTHLAKIDHKNTYKVYLRPPASQGQALEVRTWPDNFKFITIPYSRLWTQIGLAKQTFIDKLDVLFVPSHTLPLIRKPGLKAVITVHDLGAKYLPKMHQLKQQLYLKFMTDVQLKTATHIIAVSQATKNDIIHNIGIQPDKISVVYEGYDKDKFKVQSVIPRLRSGQECKVGKSSYFLFVGTIQPRKNLERLIEAYAGFLISWLAKSMAIKKFGAVEHKGDLNPSANSGAKPALSEPSGQASGFLRHDKPGQVPNLVLVGSKGWMSEEIYALPKKLGIEKYVKFLGYVPDEALPSLYSKAEGLLFPSLFEGFGLPILEAFSCGCPVLTSNISSMPEVAGKAAILVNPYSIDDITQGIKRIMNQELKIKLIKAGFEQAKKFSWQKAAQETLRVLEN